MFRLYYYVDIYLPNRLQAILWDLIQTDDAVALYSDIIGITDYVITK